MRGRPRARVSVMECAGPPALLRSAGGKTGEASRVGQFSSGAATTALRGSVWPRFFTTEVTEGHRGRQEIQREGTARMQSLTVSAPHVSPSVISVTSVVKKEKRGF